MLRRVLIPFSELFILLTLVFLTLFFVSAALSGRGEDRPSDALHLIAVSANAALVPVEPRDPHKPWPGTDEQIFAVADVARFADQEWAYFWGSGLDSAALPRVQWQSVRLDGNGGDCTSLSDATRGRGIPMGFEDANAGDLSGNRIERVLSDLPGIGPQLSTRADFALLHGEPVVLDSSDLGALDTAIHSATVSVAYRPNDIQNDFVLLAGLLLHDPQDYDPQFWPPLSKGGLVYSHVELLSGDEAHGALVLGPRLEVSWQENGSFSPAPLYYESPDCDGNESARLFVVFSANGTTATPYDPRIQR